MFTGLVQYLSPVVELIAEPPGQRIVVREQEVARQTRAGDSIAVSGCCLTVVDVAGDTLAFQAGEETLSRTNLGELHPGTPVNLECALKVGDPLGGHYVTGHIDGLGTLEERIDDAEWSTFWFHAPEPLMRQMASKGSIAVDGVSLTLVDVERRRFRVALIPHTLEVTTLGRLRPGATVNLETDVLAKYVQRQLETS